jgi:hypothetical protein
VGTIQEWICALNPQEKMKKNEEFGKNGFSEKKWKKLKNSLMDGRRWVGWSERGRRWDGGGWEVMGGGDLDVRE